MSQMTRQEMQRDFMYLFERMGEPLGMGMKGPIGNMVYYNVPPDQIPATRTMKPNMMAQKIHPITVERSVMPMRELQMISSMCPRRGIFGYFIPEHRQALLRMKKIFMDQRTPKELFNMASACRDSQMVHPHLFINALGSSLASRTDTKGFDMPAFYEIMPDLFLTDHVIKQAEQMARMPNENKNIILVDRNTTGHQSDPESRMWYFREDIGVNSHHFHWHVVFPGDYGDRMEMKRDRRGELFYYMHHSMICRYDTERLCNGLSRTKVFDFDNLVLEEGYFGKLYSTNGGRHWGTRQSNTKLINLYRSDAINSTFWDLKVEDLKKWRDRISEAIDTGYIIRSDGEKGERREKLNEKTGIDILGDIIENSQDTPHGQFYGVVGFHNMGHVLIAFSNDPLGKYKETFGPMGDTSTALRDPAFYRWHKYLDQLFDQYKRTLGPYELKGSSWPLVWDGIFVDSIEVDSSNSRMQKKNMLSTHWMQTDIDLARGLDFWRTDADNGGPVWARITHLNSDLFTYTIKVRNQTLGPVDSTVRIFMAPRNDEHGDRIDIAMQRLLFFELDKFSHKLAPGLNTIIRKSEDSSVTIRMENSFRQLENLNSKIGRNDFKAEEGRCGCGWPQHLLLPRGTPSGMAFDLFVMITDGRKDLVPKKNVGPKKGTCRDALSFCGILDEDFPDARPMGYPFDRIPYNNPESTGMSVPVSNLDQYVKFIPNAAATQITIIHEPNVVKGGSSGAPAGMKMVNEKGEPVNMRPSSSGVNVDPQNMQGSEGKGGQVIFGELNNQGGNKGQWTQPNRQNLPAGASNQWYGPTQRGSRNSSEGDWDYLDN